MDLSHNGNLTNAAQLRDELESRGSIFRTTVDSEIILHLMAQPGLNSGENHLSARCAKSRARIRSLSGGNPIGRRARPIIGFRPLSIGKLELARRCSPARTCALDLIHAKFVRDVEPGEIVVISEKGLQ